MTTFVIPDLPQTNVTFTGETPVSIPVATNTVVAIIGTHNRGPINTPNLVPFKSLPEWEAVYGSDDSQGRRGVVQAFLRGAGGVYFIRLAVSGTAAAATKNVPNTTPATALVLTANSKGLWGNDISYVVEDDPIDSAKDRLRILYKGATVESYSYTDANVASVRDAINNRPSRYVTATAPITGVALGHVSATALAAGNDGSSVTSTEYDNAQNALAFKDFGLFAPAGLTDAAIKVQLATWIKSMATEMRPIRAVFGGALAEDVDTAIAELSSNPTLRDPHVIRFGVGTWHDDTLDLDMSTAELAPGIAGILASRGERAALTRAPMPGLTIVGSGATKDELIAGRNAGITMLRQVTSAVAELAVSQGVTTFIDTTQDAQPYELFSEPRIVGLLDRIIRQITVWGDTTIIGDVPVNDDTRNEVRKELLKILDDLVTTGLAKPGTTFAVVDPPDDPSLEDAVPFTFGFVPTRTANYLIGQGHVR